MAAPIPDKSCRVFYSYYLVWAMKNAAGYHPGTVTPSTTNGAPLAELQV